MGIENTKQQATALKYAAELLDTVVNKFLPERIKFCDNAVLALENLETVGKPAAAVKADLLFAFRLLADSLRAWDAWNVAFFGINPADYKEGIDDDACYGATYDAWRQNLQTVDEKLAAIKAALN